jgi:hypothetical protein
MKDVELYAKVRRAVRIEGLSRRAVARRFGVDPRTVGKMLEFSVPPGYRRSKPPVKPKFGPFIGIIDVILAEDKGRPKAEIDQEPDILCRGRYIFTSTMADPDLASIHRQNIFVAGVRTSEYSA